MSCRPNAFGANEPAGAVCPKSHWLPQLAQLARFRPISSPQWYFVVVPARAANSHSASLGKP